MELSKMEEEDCLQEAYSVITEMKLQLMVLENERNTLKEENKQLKSNLQQVMINESISLHKSQYRFSQETRDKWACYRENKKEVSASMSNPHWRDIKRETDKIYYARLESQKT